MEGDKEGRARNVARRGKATGVRATGFQRPCPRRRVSEEHVLFLLFGLGNLERFGERLVVEEQLDLLVTAGLGHLAFASAATEGNFNSCHLRGGVRIALAAGQRTLSLFRLTGGDQLKVRLRCVLGRVLFEGPSTTRTTEKYRAAFEVHCDGLINGFPRDWTRCRAFLLRACGARRACGTRGAFFAGFRLLVRFGPTGNPCGENESSAHRDTFLHA
jgi:hypothetical protein